MFESGMAESEAEEIKIRDVPFSGLYALLQFIYSGTADVNYAIAQDVFVVANQVLIFLISLSLGAPLTQ